MKLAEDAEKDLYLVMEGDWGGQIYLTVPAKFVDCDDAALMPLLEEIDGIAWGCNAGDGKSKYFLEKLDEPDGDIVYGGMGCGYMEAGLWVHPQLQHLRPKIEAVLYQKPL